MTRSSACAKILFIAAAVNLFAGTGSMVLAEVRYTITDLGSLGGTSNALGINNKGQVVGGSYLSDDATYHAFLYSDGIMTDMGAFGGTGSLAYNINDAGQVVGVSYLSGSPWWRPFLYSDGVMSDLNSNGAIAMGINNSAQIVGMGYNGNGDLRAFIYSGDSMSFLETLGGASSYAYSINDAGQVAGGAHLSGYDEYHPILYSDGVMTDLGTFGGTQGDAYAINDVGQVVGWARDSSGIAHAFLYSSGSMVDLGTLGGGHATGNAINNNGQVVGYATTNGLDSPHAFLYRDGVMTDMNNLIDPSSGWTLMYANAIRDDGVIVGSGLNSAGEQHAYLLTPVPEPASLLLLSFGGMALLRRKRA